MTTLVIEGLNSDPLEFRKLETGTVFKYGVSYFIKIKLIDGFNALNLNLNEAHWFGNDIEVDRVAKSLIINF